MNTQLSNRRLEAPAQMSPRELNVVLATARSLQSSTQAGRVHAPLRGKNLALLSDEPDSEESQRFTQAAEQLGAHVAQIRPLLSELGTPEALQHTARMLGRLYEAVECQGLPADLVALLGQAAGIPFFDGLAQSEHATAQLADLLQGTESHEEKRALVLQAVLVNALA